MLSRKLFEQLEYICRKIVNSSLVFGGLQVIVVGDNFQLPPVPDYLKMDSGEYCFKSPVFDKIFCHKIILKEVMRQNQDDFIQAINDVSRGDIPENTLNLIKRLSCHLPPGEDPIRLCARNFDCFIYNACKLMDMDGEEFDFCALDEGDVSKLERTPVPQHLHIKLGCPVMLLKNLSEHFVNGLRGIVTSASKESITVNFTDINSKISQLQVKRETFTVYSSIDSKVIASRRQFPLCLAFSITIHKAQGLTLDRVEVDASCIFAPGQLGVAIGRAREKKGLRIIGFNESSIMRHEPGLYKYYDHTQSKFDDINFLCCKQNFNTVNDIPCISVIEPLHEELSDFSDGEIDEMDFLLSNEHIELDETETILVEEKIIDISEITDIFSIETEAPFELSVCAYYKELLKTQRIDIEYFVNKLYTIINDLFTKTCGDVTKKSTEPKIWTKYYTELYKFSTSNEYISLVKLISHCEPTGQDFEMCSKIYDKVTSVVLQKHTEHLLSSHDVNYNKKNTMSDSGKGKLRYIFGRCIAKSRFHNMKHAKTNMYKKKNRESLAKSFIKVKMLDSLTKNYTELVQDSKYNKTLLETQRKQSLSQGLTNITDETYEFILKVDEKRLSVQQEKVFHLYGADFLSHCHNVLLKDTNLFNIWRILFQSFDYCNNYLRFVHQTAEQCLHELFEDVVHRFCRIADNQFRKDFLMTVGKSKTESLRKRVDSKTVAPSILNMKNIYNDKSVSKQSTHFKLKSAIFDQGNSAFVNFVKNDLLKLCKSYDIKMSCSSSNDVIKQKLCSKIPSLEGFSHPQYLQQAVSDTTTVSTSTKSKHATSSEATQSTSGEATPSTPSEATPSTSIRNTSATQPRRRKRKSKFTTRSQRKSSKTENKEEKETVCPLCQSVYIDGDDWIACDLCDLWYDRKCLNLNDDQWDDLEGSDWYCPDCLK